MKKEFFLTAAMIIVSATLSCSKDTALSMNQGNPDSSTGADKTEQTSDCQHAKIFSIKDYGAVGDGKTLNTQAIQSAIDCVWALGGGTVFVPSGVSLTGSIWLKDNVNLYLDAGAVIKGSPNINDYCAADCCPQNEAEIGWGDYMSGGHLILGVGVSNVSISGRGRIDGNSDAFMLDKNGKLWPEKSKIPNRPGQMIWFVDSKDIKIKDVEIADSPYWSLFILNSDGVTVDGCYVHTKRKEYHTYNGDGIDIDRCRYVTISNCRIDTSDDCLTLRASTANRLEKPQDCEFVTVTNCNLSTNCNAIRLGVGEGNIHDAVFSNLTISDTNLAFNIVGAYVRGNRGTDIYSVRFNNIIVQANELIRIHHMYSPQALIKDIVFDGISGTAPNVSHLWAKQAAPFRNIVFRNVDVSAYVECVNAEVKIEGGLFKKKELSSKELQERINNIENHKNLLH